ncbi:MAG: hypothetical protein N6V49_09770, partial [Serratia symbiotica]|nr:hypothetical protein [Serratia symbiotica]
RISAYPSGRTLLLPICSRIARNNRSVPVLREDGEHGPGSKWQIKQSNGIGYLPTSRALDKADSGDHG